MRTRPKITVDVSETGWPRYIGGPPNICTTVLERRRAGLPACDELAIWQVSERGPNCQYLSWYCDEHLPDEAHDALGEDW